MGACANCKYAGRPTYKSPCSECKDHSKHEPVEIRTNADRIRAMSDEELVKFLNRIAFGRETPWADPFAQTFCDKCPPIKATVVETGKEIEICECEFADGKCPHGDDVLWWLKEPVEEVNRDAE